MRKIVMVAALLGALGVAGVQAANKKAPATQAPGAMYPCTEDCNTRQGGYRWAEHYAIARADDCKGASVAFVNGCKDYVSQVAKPRDDRADNGAGTRADNRYGGRYEYGDEGDRDERYEDDGRGYDRDRYERDGYDDGDRYDDDGEYEDDFEAPYDDGYDDDREYDDDDDRNENGNGALQA